MSSQNLQESNIERSQHFLGVVVDNKDPEFRARCKVRVFGVFDDVKDEDLPWAFQRFDISFGDNGGSGRVSIPKLGCIVHVQFNNGNYYSPEYKAVQELSKDLITEISASYEGAHSLIYDGIEKLKIYYTVAKGLVIDLKESTIVISNDNSITITHAGQTSTLEFRGGKITEFANSEIESTATTRIKQSSNEVWVDGKTTKLGHAPVYSAILAEPLWMFLKQLAAAVDAKLPSTPGTMTSLAESYEQLSTSDVVKVTKSN
jgi:hypothetical protein